jgi:hypothetical protein
MKLITETIENVKALVEATDNGDKNYYIEGIMMQGEKVNRNGRKYSIDILENECKRYMKEYVNKKRAWGELNHPSGPTVNLDRVSHMIVELKQIIDTPMGRIVKALIDEGALLGVSSRGMGTLKRVNEINEVQSDFTLAAIDIVSDPSAPDAFVNGILEGKEWVWDNGKITEKTINEYKKEIERTSSRDMEKKALKLFENFLRNI